MRDPSSFVIKQNAGIPGALSLIKEVDCGIKYEWGSRAVENYEQLHTRQHRSDVSVGSVHHNTEYMVSVCVAC